MTLYGCVQIERAPEPAKWTPIAGSARAGSATAPAEAEPTPQAAEATALSESAEATTLPETAEAAPTPHAAEATALSESAEAEPTPHAARADLAPIVSSSPAPPPVDVETDTKERGRISMYGKAFSGKKTASGKPFDPAALTMAHRTLPFGTRVRVTNLENRRSVEVVVNDRGPFVSGRIADVSQAAARRLDMAANGVVEGFLDVVEPAQERR
ncbi:MAG: septal ring lytic transglycosylase RlpA family protein [Burkholderiales bacterium]|nr:septal ring lytic transglycosylase RlpA family protein [Burkholderiales bacterium]